MRMKLVGSVVLSSLASSALALDLPAKCEVSDPEFHDAFGILVYQHVNQTTDDREAIAQFMDNGDLDTGTDFVVATDVAPFPFSQAGPKFSHGEDSNVPEDYLVYTRLVNAQTFAVGVRKYDLGAPNGACSTRTNAAACFPSSLDGQIPLDTPDQGTERRIVYTTEEETYEYRAQAIYHRLDDQEAQFLSWAPLENFLDDGGNGQGELSYEEDSVTIWGRLQEKKIDDSPATFKLMASTIHVPSGSGGGGAPQIFLIDATNPATVEQVTDVPGAKFNAYLFRHAGLDRNMVVVRLQPNASQSNLVVFVEETLGMADWTPFAALDYEDISSPNERFLLSPETFYFDNGTTIDTYLLFSTADYLEIPNHTRGSIWIARIANNGSIFPAKISNASENRVRVEPEVHFPSPTSLPVFFYTQYSHEADEEECVVQTCDSGTFCVENFNLRRIVLSAQEMP